jgi:hypothetical protein
MAIGRISGQMLKSNLLRSGTDLAFETTLLVLDVTNSRVGVGTASPATAFHVSATDAIRIPSGTDAQRPGTPANGDIRYNTDQTRIEGYSNGAWANLSTGSALLDQDTNTGIDVERDSDQNEIHFFTETSGDVAHIRDNGDVEFAGLKFEAATTTISSLTTNGDITFTPNGTGKVAISSAMEITGNLTVNGTTTTIDSTTLVIEDPLIQLAKNNSGGAANSFDQGLFFNRGSNDNVSFLWDESADEFVAAVTSGEDGTTAGNVTIDSYADFKAKDIESSGGNFIGSATGITTLTASSTVNLNGGTLTFNDDAANTDARFESTNETHMLFLDASEDHIGIATDTPAYVLDASGSTDAFRITQGNTAERPTPSTGVIRFNSQEGQYEGSTDGSTWAAFATAGDVPVISKVSTTGDGSTTTFTGFFSVAPAGVANVLVFIDNVFQEPTENYSVSSNNITFTSAPHSGARIFAIVGFDNTALASGGVARSETTGINYTSSTTTLLSFNATTYRAAEVFIVTTDSANGEYEVGKANIVHNGSTAFVTVYGLTSTAGVDLATYTVQLAGGAVQFQAVSAGGQQNTKVQYSLSSV